LRGSASERLAEELLKALGFKVAGRRVPVELEGREVAEVDLLLEPPEGKVAVEVKAGKVDVSAVRQAYANAKALGAEPMVVGSGWANEEARLLAEKLGVRYLMFQDLLVADREELYATVRTAVTDALVKLILSIEPSEEACLLWELKDPKELERKIGKEKAKEIVRSLGRAGSWDAVLAAAKLSCMIWKIAKG